MAPKRESLAVVQTEKGLILHAKVVPGSSHEVSDYAFPQLRDAIAYYAAINRCKDPSFYYPCLQQ